MVLSINWMASSSLTFEIFLYPKLYLRPSPGYVKNVDANLFVSLFFADRQEGEQIQLPYCPCRKWNFNITNCKQNRTANTPSDAFFIPPSHPHLLPRPLLSFSNPNWGALTWEIKFHVTWSYVKRQTAKMKLWPSVLSSLKSRVKIFVFVANSRRHFSIFMWFNEGLEEKNTNSEVIFAVWRIKTT